MNLSDIRDGETIVLDTNILVYANRGLSASSAYLLERCADGEVHGIVPMPMVLELTHTLMLIEARENDWIEGAHPARQLTKQPDRIRRLTQYEKQMCEFMGMGLRLEPLTVLDVMESMAIQREYGLLTNDSALAAVARRLNCDALVTADKAFSRLSEWRVVAPDDLKD